MDILSGSRVDDRYFLDVLEVEDAPTPNEEGTDENGYSRGGCVISIK